MTKPIDEDIWCDPDGLVADVHRANAEVEHLAADTDGGPE